MIKILNMYKEMRKWRQRAVDAEDLNKHWERVVNQLQEENKRLRGGRSSEPVLQEMK